MPLATQVADKPYSVLIVEDDQDDAFLLNRALNFASSSVNAAVRVTHSRTGLDGLAAVARDDLLSELPDVIVVDLNMPVMNGEEFLRQLRGRLELVEIPAVVLTTSPDQPLHDAARAAGTNAVFVKPNSQIELLKIAKTIMDFAVKLTSNPRAGPFEVGILL